MAVAMMVDNPEGSQAIYDRVRERLGLQKPGGGILHVAGPSPNGGWRVIEVWESEEDAKRFVAERLLPAFDQFVLGPGTRDEHVLAPARRGAVSRAAGWISPVVVAGGRVAGVWTVDGPALAITLFAEAEPFDRAALDAEIGELGRALGGDLDATVAVSCWSLFGFSMSMSVIRSVQTTNRWLSHWLSEHRIGH